MRTPIRFVGFVFLILFGGTGCEATLPPNTVAVASDHTLSADGMVDILQGRDASIPGTADVVRTVADLWVDYTLLAEKALEDPDFSSIDVAQILEPELEQEVILSLRNQVVQVDTVFTDDELRAAFEREGGNVQLRARHILFTYPPNSTQAQRDSVQALAAEVRRRAVDGEDFSALAETYSQDPGSAARGGDLGTFGRGRMVPAFEQAAYALEEDEISGLVESPYGIHIIRVDERIVPPFEDSRTEFEQQLKNRTVAVAESTFVAGIEEGAEVTIQEGAVALTRELAADPAMELDDPDRVLVSYEGGEFTASEFQSFIQTRPPNERGQMAEGTDVQLEVLLHNLTRRELLLGAARDQGFEVDAARRDTLIQRFRTTLEGMVGDLGFGTVDPGEGESENEAIQRQVRAVLDQILRGQINIVPLGAFGFKLREGARAGVYDEGVQAVVEILAAFEGGGQPAGPAGPPSPAPEADDGGG